MAGRFLLARQLVCGSLQQVSARVELSLRAVALFEAYMMMGPRARFGTSAARGAIVRVRVCALGPEEDQNGVARVAHKRVGACRDLRSCLTPDGRREADGPLSGRRFRSHRARAHTHTHCVKTQVRRTGGFGSANRSNAREDRSHTKDAPPPLTN